MIDLRKLNEEYEIVIRYKAKDGKNKDSLDEQDKKHIRIMAILQLGHDQQIDYVLSRDFKEKFIFDKKTQMAYYCIKILRRKEGKKYADC